MFRRPLIASLLVFASFGVMQGAGAGNPVEYQSDSIVVLDGKDGSQRWRVDAEDGRAINVVAIGGRTLLAMEGKCVNDAIAKPELIGFDVRRGDELWRNRFRAFGFATISHGVWVASNEGGAVGIDAKTGETRWTIDGLGYVEAQSSDTVFVLPFSAGVGATDLRAHDRVTGKHLWSYPVSTSIGAHATVAASDATRTIVAVGGFDGRSISAEGASTPFGPTTFFVLDSATGIQRSAFTLGDPVVGTAGGGAVLSGNLLAVIDGFDVVAVDLTTGAEHWRHAFSQPIPLGQASLRGRLIPAEGGRLAVFSSLGVLGPDAVMYAWDVATGTQVWSRTGPGLLHFDRASGASRILSSHSARDVLSLESMDLSTGMTRWQQEIPLPPDRAPYLFTNNSAVAITEICGAA